MRTLEGRIAMSALRMERQTATRRCVVCGAPAGRRANALRCAVCARAARLARKAGRRREARTVEIAKRAPRMCAKYGRAIVGRAAQATHCIECAKPLRPPREDRYCVGCGVNMGKRRSDARRCRPCARVYVNEYQWAQRAFRRAMRVASARARG